MKSSKFFGKWLIVILLMAIGIGTYAALSLADKDVQTAEQQEGQQEAAPQTYLTNQRKHDIDMDALSLLMGDYQSEEGGWQLSIKDEYKQSGPYLTVCDNTGEPGFEGRIMYLKDDLVIIEIDEELYRSMPDNWKLEGEDKYAILDCVKTDDGVELGYRGSNLLFRAV